MELKVIVKVLQLIAGTLLIASDRRHIAQFVTNVVDPKNTEAETIASIRPQIDQIQTSINDLKMKDQKVAQDLFDDAISSMRIKYQGISASDPKSLKHHSKRIESDLKSAQEKALAANHSGLKAEEKLDSFIWIIVTEMLRVLNEATSKSSLEPGDLKRIETVLRVAQEKCFKYLNKANEIEAITDFVAGEIQVEGYQASWKLFSTDRTEQLCQLLYVNIQAMEFFRMMEEMYTTASCKQVNQCNWGTDGQLMGLVATSNEASTPLIMGLSPLDLISKLEASKGINEGVIKPYGDSQAGFQFQQLRIQALGMIRKDDPDSCIKAGLREVANMVHGGTAKANSWQWPQEPGQAFRTQIWCERWYSATLDMSIEAQYIERNLSAPVIPLVLAVKGSPFGYWRAPSEFKFIARGKDDKEWETILQVDGLKWKTSGMSLATWRFWPLDAKKSIQSFRLEMKNTGKAIEIEQIRLYC